jgi:hypothetical protein
MAIVLSFKSLFSLLPPVQTEHGHAGRFDNVRSREYLEYIG